MIKMPNEFDAKLRDILLCDFVDFFVVVYFGKQESVVYL